VNNVLKHFPMDATPVEAWAGLKSFRQDPSSIDARHWRRL
jgi:hypothetical protein